MPSIPREVAEHTFKIYPRSKLVKQRLHRFDEGKRLVKQRICHFDEGKRRTIGEEIAKLLVAGFIKEVYHQEWLANPVLVGKKSGK